jgi:hypothetical protein
MNCANHPDTAPVAYCRTCGKPLCANCTRDVKGVIYCENCLADRLQGIQPNPVPSVPGFVPSAPVTPSSGPNPAVAGILAGFFPFGVGAVYCGQYAKGLAHLVIFTLLVWGESVINNDGINTMLGLGIAFFYVWQIIDSVRTAKAIQMGQPPPDPLGLAHAFGAADPIPAGQQPLQPTQGATATQQPKIPTAAVVLIGLGVLFLLQTAGVFEFGWDRVWPFFLIGLGIWMYAVREGWVGSRRISYYQGGRKRSLIGPVVLVTVGMLSLFESYGGPRWSRTWPVLLLAIGITKLLESRTPPPPSMPPGLGPTGGVTSDVQPPPTTEVRNG